MDRKDFLKKFGFGALTTMGGLSIVDRVIETNEIVETRESQINPKRVREAAICLTWGNLRDGRDFPLRPMGIVTDGTPILFVWPSERGQARGYVKSFDEVKTPIDQIVFRLAQERPAPPYYLRWRRGDYYLYTHTGCLVKRAVACIKEADTALAADQTNTYYVKALQALSDLRFAVILNLTVTGGGQTVMDELAELDEEVRRAGLNVSQFWKRYTALLTETR